MLPALLVLAVALLAIAFIVGSRLPTPAARAERLIYRCTIPGTHPDQAREMARAEFRRRWWGSGLRPDALAELEIVAASAAELAIAGREHRGDALHFLVTRAIELATQAR